METKILMITARQSGDSYLDENGYEQDVGIELETETLSIEQIMSRIARCHPFVAANKEILTELLKSPDFKNALNDAGWVDSSKINQAEKVQLEKEFFVVDHYGYTRKIDLDTLRDHDFKDLAKKHTITQKVDMKSFRETYPEGYEIYKKLKEKSDEIRKVKQALQKTKKEKKIEEAKKLLQDEGLI